MKPLELSRTAVPTRWFPRLAAGYRFDAASQAETLASVAWLLMTELHAYIEDLEGAADTDDVVDVLRLKLAELLTDLDCRLSGASTPDELHQFPLLIEYGLTQVTYSSGADTAQWMGFGTYRGMANAENAANAANINDMQDDAPQDTLSEPQSEGARLIALFNTVLAAFPGTLFNPLLPGTQGQVLRTLRAWDKLCRLAGRDAAFLVPLMKSL